MLISKSVKKRQNIPRLWLTWLEWAGARQDVWARAFVVATTVVVVVLLLLVTEFFDTNFPGDVAHAFDIELVAVVAVDVGLWFATVLTVDVVGLGPFVLAVVVEVLTATAVAVVTTTTAPMPPTAAAYPFDTSTDWFGKSKLLVNSLLVLVFVILAVSGFLLLCTASGESLLLIVVELDDDGGDAEFFVLAWLLDIACVAIVVVFDESPFKWWLLFSLHAVATTLVAMELVANISTSFPWADDPVLAIDDIGAGILSLIVSITLLFIIQFIRSEIDSNDCLLGRRE